MSQNDDIIAFFLALPEERRREYQALAELDRRYGEEVSRERRERGTPLDTSKGGS